MRKAGSQKERRGGRASLGSVLSCLATPLIFFSSPAPADVIELQPNGTILVRAADRSSEAPRPAEASLEAVEVQLPPEALTLTSGSVAPAAYQATVEQLAEAHQISPVLLEAVVWQESRWRAGARSPAGAIGLAQLMPGTARDLGVNPLDPTSNLAGGARYLRQQLDRFGGDIERALAAYNAGPGRVLRAGGIPPINETRAYVRSVVDRLSSSTNPQGRTR